MKISNISSKDGQVSFTAQYSSESPLFTLPSLDIDAFIESGKYALDSINKLDGIISDLFSEENYRDLRASGVESLKKSLSALIEQINLTVLRLNADVSNKYLEEEFGYIESSLKELEKQKSELDILKSVRVRLKTALINLKGIFDRKIKFYKAWSSLSAGEIRVGLVILDNGDYEINIASIPLKFQKEEAVIQANWKEYLSKDIRKNIDGTLSGLNEKKEILKNLMKDRFNPWVEFEKRLMVGEFLRYRAEIANFWNSEFSFTEGLPYHYFKAQKFYGFFENSLLKKLNEVKESIDNHSHKMMSKFDLKENPSNLFQDISVEEFLSGKNLRLAQGNLDKIYFSFESLEKKMKPLADKVWDSTMKEMAKKLNGSVHDKNTIVRPNFRDNNKVLKTELIVITKDSDPRNGRAILNGKFRDLVTVKSENFTEVVELTNESGTETIEINTKLEYLLSSNSLVA